MSEQGQSLLDRIPRRLHLPYLALTLILAVLLLGSQIRQQGRGLDDAIQRARGESALAFLATMDPAELPTWNLEDSTKGDKLYGPFGVTTALFAGRLIAPLIGDVEEMRWLDFHAGLALWFLLLFWATCHLGRRATGSVTGGALAGLLLLLQPRILGLATVNPSDLPAAAATALTLLAFWRWWDERGWWEVVAVSASLAMSAAIRAQNAITLLPLLLGALLMVWLAERRRGEGRPLPRAQLLVAPLLTYALFILFWFDFWFEPIQGPLQLIQGFLQHSDRYVQQTLWFGTPAQPRLFVPVVFLFTTPVWVLVPFVLGLFVRKHRALPLFGALGLWMLLSMGKHLMGMANHGGIRHFLDAYVPLSIFAAWALLWLGARIGRRPMEIALLALLFLYFPLNARGRPYECSYYNLLIGGPRGAVGKFDMEPDGSSFVQLLYALRPELRKGDILLNVGPRDLVTQLRLPHDPVVHELLPGSLPLFRAQAQKLFEGHRVLVLFGQDRSWGHLDRLIADGVLEVLVTRGVAGLPVMMALEVKKPSFWNRLPELFGP